MKMTNRSTSSIYLPRKSRKHVTVNGVQIAGCQKSHMISLFPDGSWQTKRHICSCCSCKRGKFIECDGELSEHNTPNEESIDNDLDLLTETDDPEMYTFVEEKSYVALYSAPKSLELFLCTKSMEKTVANDDIIDIYGHTIQKGPKFIQGYYLEKVDEKKVGYTTKN